MNNKIIGIASILFIIIGASFFLGTRTPQKYTLDTKPQITTSPAPNLLNGELTTYRDDTIEFTYPALWNITRSSSGPSSLLFVDPQTSETIYPVTVDLLTNDYDSVVRKYSSLYKSVLNDNYSFRHYSSDTGGYYVQNVNGKAFSVQYTAGYESVAEYLVTTLKATFPKAATFIDSYLRLSLLSGTQVWWETKSPHEYEHLFFSTPDNLTFTVRVLPNHNRLSSLLFAQEDVEQRWLGQGAKYSKFAHKEDATVVTNLNDAVGLRGPGVYLTKESVAVHILVESQLKSGATDANFIKFINTVSIK